MVFSSLVFLYVFLPVVLIGYYVIPYKFKNLFLSVASFIFFAWGGVSYSLILLFSLILNFFIGKGIAFNKNKKTFLIIGVTVNLIIIGIFKYAGLITETINSLLGIMMVSTLKIPKIILPIGISFYTFQAISYLVDIYRGEAEVQKKFTNVVLYISLFPQLIAGPIVRYHDIAIQIKNRVHSFEKFSSGVMRFVLGLGKKVLIANNLAIIADYVFSITPENLTFSPAWIGIIAYTFQIYFDFSGYSDMAIGLGRMFGFNILENFNFPYISKSIREFWRRWHISLSNWFRDYLYISMGGNRINKFRTYFNLFFVFFVTGLWHGASWGFVVWGLIHGALMIFERLGLDKILKKTPSLFQHTYTFLLAVLAWVLFRADDFSHATKFYHALFNFSDTTLNDVKLIIKLNNETFLVFAIAVLGSFGVFKYINNLFKQIIENCNLSVQLVNYIKLTIQFAFVFIVILLCTTYLVNNSYNPFIYFRF
ncbi:MAG: MBOAT family protein [Bacteroidetes bacterium]|nr:MAG: MBOAT family protein [Bacteroidota bacterium]